MQKINKIRDIPWVGAWCIIYLATRAFFGVLWALLGVLECYQGALSMKRGLRLERKTLLLTQRFRNHRSVYRRRQKKLMFLSRLDGLSRFLPRPVDISSPGRKERTGIQEGADRQTAGCTCLPHAQDVVSRHSIAAHHHHHVCYIQSNPVPC